MRRGPAKTHLPPGDGAARVHSLERAGRAALARAALARAARSPTELQRDARLRFYVEGFGGKNATRGEIRKTYLRKMGVALAEATLTRDLELLGARRTARGQFLIPRPVPASSERVRAAV